MNARISGFLTAIALAALIPTAVSAHHCKGPHANDEGCDSGGGGGGGGEPVPENIIDAGWSGGVGASDLTGPRECVPARQFDADAGHYHCDPTGVVQFNLSGGVLTSSKGSQAWCDNFNVQTTANTQYRVYWTGDCMAGACTLSLLNASVDTHDVNQANGWPADVGLLVIKANGEIEGPSTTVNPYIDTQVFDIEEFTVGFNESGSNRKLASCLFLPDPGEVVFVSTPQ